MPDQVSQWYDYIEWMINYISNPAIAFDYTNRYVHFRNGAIYANIMGFNAAWITKSTPQNVAYVYIFKMNLKPEEFGLKLPPFEIAEGIPSQNTDKVINEALKQIVKDELREYAAKHSLNEMTGGRCIIRIDEDGFKNLIKSVSLRLLSILESKGYRGYQPVACNKMVTLDNGTRTKSLVTLSDGAGRYDIGEDDSCYVVYKDRRHKDTMYIFPELQRALRKLPVLPLH